MAVWLRRLAEGFAELLFPPLCVVCRSPSPRHLCDGCIRQMPRMPAVLCWRCGRALELPPFHLDGFSRERSLCLRCRDMPREFEICRAYGPYTGTLRAAIQALKYRGKTAVAPALAELLAQVLSEEPALRQAKVLAPMPLHPARKRARGFNQSELLARVLAERAGMELRLDLVSRVRATTPQVGLSAAARLENLRGAFAVRPDRLPEGPLLLLDDVVTTGATFDACARPLREAGVPAIYALALAHD